VLAPYDDQPVELVKRCYKCPECFDGHIEFTGVILPMNPMLFKHHCLQCGHDFCLSEQTGSLHYKYKDSDDNRNRTPTT